MEMQLTDKPKMSSEAKKRHFLRSNWGMIVFFLLLALMMAFFAGLLPIAPVAVATGSMSPTIKVGDVVLILRTDAEKIEVGDIIEYSHDGYSVIHRVVERRESEDGTIELVTQGDFNNAPDEPIGCEQVEGRVLLTVPKIGMFTIRLHGLLSGE